MNPWIVDDYFTKNLAELKGPFLLKFSEPFGNGDIICPDLRDAPFLMITDKEIYYDIDGWIHEVDFGYPKSRGKDVYPKKWTVPGTQFFVIGIAVGEYD